MSHPFRHPASRSLIERVARTFRSERAYLVTDRQLLFVCGGPTGPASETVRAKFLRFASVGLRGFQVFLAEAAARDLIAHDRPRFLNVAEFEHILASISDCILIFPESPGSLCELGYFAAEPGTRSKCLIVNDFRRQADESFINNGPLSIFNQHSAFRPTIHIAFEGSEPDFSPVLQRLDRFAEVQRRRLRLSTFDELDMKSKMAVLIELIDYFKIASVDGLGHIIKSAFGFAGEISEIRELVSILIATDCISRIRHDLDFFCLTKNAFRLIQFDRISMAEQALAVVGYYERYAPDTYSLLKYVDR